MAMLNNQRVIGAEMPDMKKWTKNEMPNAQEPAKLDWHRNMVQRLWMWCSSLVNGFTMVPGSCLEFTELKTFHISLAYFRDALTQSSSCYHPNCYISGLPSYHNQRPMLALSWWRQGCHWSAPKYWSTYCHAINTRAPCMIYHCCHGIYRH